MSFREWWGDYKAEVFFGLAAAIVVVLSTWLSRFIPDAVFDNILTPFFNTCTFAVAVSGALVIFRHSEGMRIRLFWGCALLAWGLGDLVYLICWMVAPMQLMNMGAEHITVHELLLGNLLGWVMTLYPTESLRPGWLTWKTVLWQLLPLCCLVALDYLVPLNLWPIIALYPYGLLVIVLTHIRAYRIWCENNYSTLDYIDVQWIIRYCIMLFIIGANYVYICTTHGHARSFTQQWCVVFMLVYCTEQILYRKDPWWELGVKDESEAFSPAEEPCEEECLPEAASDGPDDAMRRKLDAWMETEKPYLNPEFKLIDLRAVLPTNRTYLSQFINNTYGCSFYHFVNGYRIEEAKRLLREQPDMKIADVAARSGFSSPNVFSTVFSKEMGVGPREWSKAQSE